MSEHDDTDIEDESYCEGYRIIDLSSLVLGKAVCAKCKQGEIRICEAKNFSLGLASNLQVCCLHCSSRQTVPYPTVESSVKEKDLNQHAVLGSHLIGRCQRAMRKFFAVMNMPGYISRRTHKKYSGRLFVAAEAEA